jgi:hypothetical protein
MLIRTGPHSAINKSASPETNRGVMEGHRNPCGEGELNTNPRTQHRINMSSSIYHKRKQEIKRMIAALANGDPSLK